MLHNFIYWGAFAYFPFMLCAFWTMRKSSVPVKVLLCAGIICANCLAYGRFIEPRLLITHEETIILEGASKDSPSIRIALFGDPHLGRFGNTMPMTRISKRINSENVDAVLLAGDLTYHTEAEEIPELFAPLEEIAAPVFVVLGNHDVGFPGPDLSNPLLKTLSQINVPVVHNRSHKITVNGYPITIAGTSDLWQRRMNFDFEDEFSEEETVLLLTHNPDMAAHIPETLSYDLLLAGHTHGGQIRLPFLYRKIIPTDYPFDKELHTYPAPNGDKLVYVTTGTGMVGLPMRFAMPPRIDILTIHLPQ